LFAIAIVSAFDEGKTSTAEPYSEIERTRRSIVIALGVHQRNEISVVEDVSNTKRKREVVAEAEAEADSLFDVERQVRCTFAIAARR